MEECSRWHGADFNPDRLTALTKVMVGVSMRKSPDMLTVDVPYPNNDRYLGPRLQ